MKTAEQLYFNDIIPILDPYNECSDMEKEKDEKQFFDAIENKDMDFINHLISLFDEEAEEEQRVIDNIKYLIA